jgi:hopene-associated glycosyltransferase HpnB
MELVPPLAAIEDVCAFIAVCVWLWLILARGGFWRCDVHDNAPASAPPGWPDVVALVPARNEAAVIGASLGALLAQTYDGRFSVVVIDDQSSDGTSSIALAVARRAGAVDRLATVAGQRPSPGWTGKLWALQQGLDFVDRHNLSPRYIWLVDADIACAPDTLARLVARAEATGFVLVSLMAKMRCESLAERCLVPAFIFFFQMLYPFARVNRPKDPRAAAAGGCMLVLRSALAAIDGFRQVRSALIDDCALGAALKRQGPIALSLTRMAVSLRSNESFGDIRRMVARSAYAQLRYSPLLLAATVAAMLLVYVAPPLLTLGLPDLVGWLGLFAWLMMAFAFAPTLNFYGLSRAWAPAMPAIALAYLAFTLDSALQHWRGRGGYWKGRVYARSEAER